MNPTKELVHGHQIFGSLQLVHTDEIQTKFDSWFSLQNICFSTWLTPFYISAPTYYCGQKGKFNLISRDQASIFTTPNRRKLTIQTSFSKPDSVQENRN